MLNYSVPPLQFTIGNFDASQYLDSISLAVLMHEIGQDLLWSGRFKVSNNFKAKADGLTDDDFSEVGSPGRWRPYQQPVKLFIREYPSPVFRIENYRYNAQTRSGEGLLTQLPKAVMGDRPGVNIPTVKGGSIGGAIDLLLTAAFKDASVAAGFSLSDDGGLLDVPLTTRNPWADAVRLAGLNWRWLTVDASERVTDVEGGGGVQVFYRTPVQVELVPDLAAIYQPVSEVIVTGARQVDDNPVAPTSVAPSVPRPKFKTTREFRPASAVLPNAANDLTQVLVEEKTIIYQYFDDATWSSYLPLFSNPLTGFIFEIDSTTNSGINIYGPPPLDLNQPLQTITVKRSPVAVVFNQGADLGLITAEVIIESGVRKVILKPAGVILNNTDTTLVVDRRETLTSGVVPIGSRTVTTSRINANGQVQQYEARPVLEPDQPVPTRPLKTELLKGSARLSPLGWVPIVNQPLVVDFGFLPDESRPTFLAGQIAQREQRRREQVLVDMPIPIEWLSAGWPLLGTCQVGGDRYLMDGVVLSIAGGEAKFGFTGALVSRTNSAGVVQAGYEIKVDVLPTLVVEADVSIGVGVAMEPVVVLEMVLSSGVVVDVAGAIALETIVLVAGGEMVVPAIVFEAMVLVGDALIIPAECVFEALVFIGTLQTLNIMVSPSSVLEGSLTLQTLNITVSPSTVLEGN